MNMAVYPKNPVDLKAGDWVLTDLYAAWPHNLVAWTLNKVLLVDGDQAVIEVFKVDGRRAFGGKQKKRTIAVIDKVWIRAYGAKALIAKYRAECKRQLEPLDKAVSETNEVRYEAEGKRDDYMRGLRNVNKRMEPK